MLKDTIAALPSIRPPFLLLAPICVLYAASIAVFEHHQLMSLPLVLAIVGAVLSLISVNCFNEYQDKLSGLDDHTQRTPFSGGSGLLQRMPHLAPNVKRIAYSTLSLVFFIGCYFALTIGWYIIPIGLVGLVIIYLYTEYLNRFAFACLIAPGLGLGILVTLGSYFVLTGQIYSTNLLLLFIPFFLINNLLLLNQYPDIDADKAAGRRHFPIRFGVTASNLVYGIFTLPSILTLVYAVVALSLPKMLFLALIPLSLSFISLSAMMKFGAGISQQPKYLAMNVIAANLTPVVILVVLFNSAAL